MNVYRVSKGKFRFETRDPSTGKRVTKTILAESKSHAKSQAEKWLRTLRGQAEVPTLFETVPEVLAQGDRREVSRKLYDKNLRL